MIDISKFENQEFAARALALPFSEVVRHASVVVYNTSGVPVAETETFTGVCLELVRAAGERLKIVEPRNRFYVRARRWFDGSNTYHSVRISDSNMDELAFIPFTYGYGDHWQQTAFEWFKENGFADNAENQHPGRYMRETLCADCTVEDVKRKKDLSA